jgi:hypothetical protein
MKMSEMGSHDPFGHMKHKLWSKEKLGVKPQNVGNRLDVVASRWYATCRWKALDEGYNFALDLIPIEGLHKNY